MYFRSMTLHCHCSPPCAHSPVCTQLHVLRRQRHETRPTGGGRRCAAPTRGLRPLPRGACRHPAAALRPRRLVRGLHVNGGGGAVPSVRGRHTQARAAEPVLILRGAGAGLIPLQPQLQLEVAMRQGHAAAPGLLQCGATDRAFSETSGGKPSASTST
jgi:hypothetical protein